MQDDEDKNIERRGEYLWRTPENDSSPEPQPEQQRRKRSIFDIFRRDRETDDEVEQKKRDKELKKAAKIHARDVIEPSPNEQDDARRKVKKRWRQRLLERSRRHAEQLRADETRRQLTGVEVAQLLVAERLLQLDHFLKTPSLPKTEKKAIKTSIDFIGLLSDKLDDPRHLMPPEIEQIYDTIVEEPEAPPSQPSPEGTAPETPEPPGQDWRTPQTVPPDSKEQAPEPSTTPRTRKTPESSQRFGVFITKLVKVVQRAPHQPTPAGQRPVPQAPPAPYRTPQQPPKPYTTPQPKSSHKQLQSPRPDEPSRTTTPDEFYGRVTREFQPTIVLPTPVYIANHIETPQIMRRMQLVVETAETTPQPPRRTTEPAAPATPPTTIARVDSHIKQENAPEPTIAKPETQTRESSHEPDDTPVQFWSLSRLLHEAAGIDVGHGRYLSYAYKRGEIDKNGLIAVIKAKKRNQDFRMAFKEQRTSYSNRIHRSGRSPESHDEVAESRPTDDSLEPVQTIPQPDTTSQATTHTTRTTRSHYSIPPQPRPYQQQLSPRGWPKEITETFIVVGLAILGVAIAWLVG